MVVAGDNEVKLHAFLTLALTLGFTGQAQNQHGQDEKQKIPDRNQKSVIGYRLSLCQLKK
jgi:hypothetical protein